MPGNKSTNKNKNNFQIQTFKFDLGFNIDLKFDLKSFEEFLTDKSYICEHWPTQSDAVLYNILKEEPPGENFPNIFRWFHHIHSYGNSIQNFPLPFQVSWMENVL